MSAIGELNFYLGLQVLQKEDGIFLSQDTHQVTPKECHLHAVKRIFRYLKGHPKLRLWYPKESPFDLVAYSDSDYGGATHDRKSTTEGCQFFGRRLSMPCEALSKESSSSILRLLCHNENKLKHLLEFLTFEALWYDLSFIERFHTAKTFDLVWIWLGGDYGNIFLIGFNGIQCNKIMARLQFCDYHNMVSILEKSEHNVDFHPIVDFVEASPLRYALTFKPTVYVSYIRQFWSTARIETTKEGTKILATCLSPKSTGFNEFSSNIATALVCLATNRVYNFSKMIFDGMGEGPGTPTEPHHTPSLEAQQTSPTTHSSLTLPPITTAPIPTVTSSDTPHLRQYTRRARISQSSALPPVADEPTSPLKDVSQCEACPIGSSLDADQDMVNIAKTSVLPYDSAPRVTSHAVNEGSMQHKLDELTALCTSLQRQQSDMVFRFEAQELEINSLMARIKLLEDKDRGVTEHSGDDAPIKGRRLDVGKEAAERVSDDTAEMATVLTSIDAATVLASGVAEVPTGSGFIPTAGPPAAEVPTGSDVVPTVGPIIVTATVVTPYTRRKGKETMVESETPKKKKVQEQIDAQVVRELEEQIEREAQRMNEQIARDAEIARIHAEEELQIMIDGLDRSNETVAKYLQEYHQFAIELPLERRIELISDLVRGMTFEEIEAKFTTVWKQIRNFIPMGSKEEAKRFKRKGIRFDQESMKKLKTSKEVPEEVKTPDEVPEEKVKEMMQPVPIKEHLDREDLNQLWALVKESLNIRPASSDKEMELWVELKRLEGLPSEEGSGNYDDLLQASCGKLLSDGKSLDFEDPLDSKFWSIKFRGGLLGIKCTRHSPCQLWSSHCQEKFPLPVKKVPTARRKEMPLL
nr:putative ribonuclease H-like domain-containing protein [Tanacetum cinerariifolium]